MRTIILSLASLLLVFRFGYSQSQWTFQQCVDQASKQNITIQQASLRLQSATVNQQRAKADYLPSLTGQAWNTTTNSMLAGPYDSKATPVVVPVDRQMWQSGQLMLQADLNLWQGFRVHYTCQRSQLLQQASQYELEARTQDILLSVASAFLEVLYQQEQARITTNQMEATAQQAQRIAAQVEAGSVPAIELSRIKYQQAVEQAQLTSNNNAISRALLSLAQLLELPNDQIATFAISAPALSSVDTTALQSADLIFAEALKNRPSIKQRETLLAAYQTSVKVARAEQMPTVFIRSQVLTNYNTNQRQWTDYSRLLPMGSQFGDNATANLMVGIRIPIFNNFNLRTAVTQARINEQLAQYDVTLENKQLYKNVQQAWFDVSSARQQYRAQAQAVGLAQKNYEVIKLQYESGATNGVNFAIEKNNLAKAEADLLRSKYQAIFTGKVLELYQTAKIELN